MSNEKRLVIFGEVLFDCFPDGSQVLGGAPFNVAWHCQAFGLNPLFISRVGDDQQGEQISQAMRNWGMSTAGLQIDGSHPTGKVDVSFNNGEPAYDIVINSAWDFISREELPKIDEQIILYHGSLVLRNEVSAASFDFLKKTTQSSIFIDVNLRPPYWNAEDIKQLLIDCKWLKLNEDELKLIMPQQAELEYRVESLFKSMALQQIVVTQGEEGVTAFESVNEPVRVKPELATQVIDTVGAGDSFSSVLLLGQLQQWPLQLTLQRAQQFASAVVGLRGATIDSMDFYQPFIDEWKLKI